MLIKYIQRARNDVSRSSPLRVLSVIFVLLEFLPSCISRVKIDKFASS